MARGQRVYPLSYISLVIPQYSIGRSLGVIHHLLASQLVRENTSHLSDGPFSSPVTHTIDSSECCLLYMVLYRHISRDMYVWCT
jgi:hypothetical protein